MSAVLQVMCAPGGCQISLEMWGLVFEATECADFVQFAGRVLSGSHVQAQQAQALARAALCCPETARLWMKGDTQPGWAAMLRVFVAARATFEDDAAMRAAFLGVTR